MTSSLLLLFCTSSISSLELGSTVQWKLSSWGENCFLLKYAPVEKGVKIMFDSYALANVSIPLKCGALRLIILVYHAAFGTSIWWNFAFSFNNNNNNNNKKDFILLSITDNESRFLGSSGIVGIVDPGNAVFPSVSDVSIAKRHFHFDNASIKDADQTQHPQDENRGVPPT